MKKTLEKVQNFIRRYTNNFITDKLDKIQGSEDSSKSRFFRDE